MTTNEPIPTEQAAIRLWDAFTTRKPCAPVRDLIGSDDIASAYAVQDTNIARRIGAGARPVGRTIGMTSAAVQEQLGYYEPNYGALFSDREVPNGERTPADQLMQPRTAGYPQLGWAALPSGIRFLRCSGLRAQWRRSRNLSRKAISSSAVHWGRLCRHQPVICSKRKSIPLVPFGSPCRMGATGKIGNRINRQGARGRHQLHRALCRDRRRLPRAAGLSDSQQRRCRS